MDKKNFFIKTLNGMAYGLFATLIIGTIINTIASFFTFNDFVYSSLSKVSKVLTMLTGAGIGIGIAYSLDYNSLKTISLAMVGEISAYFSLSTSFVTNGSYLDNFKIGDPLTIYLVCIIVAILINLIFKNKTPVDVILIPLVFVILGLTISLLVRYPSIYVTYGIQYIVNFGTNRAPFILGIIVSVVMGMALTAPISSAAIAAMVFTIPENISIAEALNDSSYSGLVIASGAAVVGCSCQMIGFSIQARKDNNIGMLISIGIGTSMLEFKNILKKPIIWLPTIIASAILGPISTLIVKTVCMGSSAGMGTAGLVGQIGTIYSMGISNINTWISIIVLEILLPAIIVYLLDLLFRKLNLYGDGDLKV